MTEEKKNSPAISDFRKQEDGSHKGNVKLWLHHKKEGNKPYLDGTLNVNGTAISVYGNFTSLDNTERQRGEGYPVIRFSAKKEEQAALLGEAAAWPVNGDENGMMRNGKPANFRTLAVSVGGKKIDGKTDYSGGQTYFATVFDNIGDARQHLAFKAEPRVREQGAEDGATASAEAAAAGPVSDGPSF